jgi:hypothetical protein
MLDHHFKVPTPGVMDGPHVPDVCGEAGYAENREEVAVMPRSPAPCYPPNGAVDDRSALRATFLAALP